MLYRQLRARTGHHGRMATVAHCHVRDHKNIG